MGVAKSFRDLRVYQLARNAVSEIFEVTKGFPREERYELTVRFVALPGRRRRSSLRNGRDAVTARPLLAR
jgi:hypothetical protein